jgi:hypothetical protein
LAEKVRHARESLRIGGKALSRLEAIERQLIAKGASSQSPKIPRDISHPSSCETVGDDG